MNDFDLESLEQIIKQEKEQKLEEKREKKRKRSRSRDKKESRKHSHKNKSHSKSRSSHRGESSKDGKPEAQEENHKQEAIEVVEVVDPIKKQQEALEKQIEEAKKQAEEAQRDDCTVLCLRVNLQATEREIYTFFAQANVGKVRDVRLIKDQRSGKSKGVAYVEFYTPESVLMAITLSGQKLLDTQYKGKKC